MCRETLLLSLSLRPAHPRSRSLPAVIYGIPTSPPRADLSHACFRPGRRLAGEKHPLARGLGQRPDDGRPMDRGGLLLLRPRHFHRLLALAHAAGPPRRPSSILARL